MRPKAVTQRVRRNVRHARGGRMGLDDSPGIVSRHRAATVQKQFRPALISKLFAHAPISLQPVTSALADRNAALLAAFALAGNQRRIKLNITGPYTARLRDS